MKKSIATRVIILVLGVVLMFGATASFAEETSAVSGWSTSKAVAATEAKDYELVVIEPEAVPLAEGPVALQKTCVLHYTLLAVAVALFFALRNKSIRMENENKELEILMGAHC